MEVPQIPRNKTYVWPCDISYKQRKYKAIQPANLALSPSATHTVQSLVSMIFVPLLATSATPHSIIAMLFNNQRNLYLQVYNSSCYNKFHRMKLFVEVIQWYQKSHLNHESAYYNIIPCCNRYDVVCIQLYKSRKKQSELRKHGKHCYEAITCELESILHIYDISNADFLKKCKPSPENM